MNKAEALKLAKDRQWNGGLVEGWTFNTTEQLLAFSTACEKIGMEKAATICEDRIDVWAKRNKFRPAELADMADTELQSAADAIRTEIK